MKTLILTEKDVKRLIDMSGSLKAVEEAFREYGKGKTTMPPKIYLTIDKFNGDFRAMPSFIEKTLTCNLKWVNVHPGNKKLNLPTVMAVNILSDPKNGFPLCVMAGTLATGLRTGASGAVAAKYLARKNSEIVSLIGCGVQAKSQFEALSLIYRIKEARLWDRDIKKAKIFSKAKFFSKTNVIFTAEIDRAVKGSDIIVTTTPSRKPLIKLKWLKKGVHINAIGADAPGKQELDIEILKKSKLIVDSFEQASHSGEMNVGYGKKLLFKRDVYAEFGEIVCGKKKGRTSDREITVFDSTGLAIQDAAICGLIYKTALRKNRGLKINLL